MASSKESKLKSGLFNYHMVSLLLTIGMGGVLFYNSVSGDEVRKWIEMMGWLIFAIWPIILFMLKVLDKEHLTDSTGFAKVYREVLLSRYPFLIGSNLFLTASWMFLLWSSLSTRQVEFVTDEKDTITVFLDKDNTPHDPRLGTAAQTTPLKVRMRTGKYLIYYSSGESVKAKNIEVLSVCRSMGTIQFTLNFTSPDD